MLDSATTAREVGDRLDRLEASLDRIERALTALAPVGPPASQLVTEAPRLAAMAADTFDAFVADVPDADARLRALLALAMRASRPETLERMTAGLDLLDSAPHAVAAAVDVFDAVLGAAAAEGVDVNVFFGVAGRFAVHLVKLGPAIDQLLESGMLDPKVIGTLGQVGQALSATTEVSPQPMGGLFGLLKVLKDPAVRRSLGFAVEVARQFGAETTPVRR